MHSQAEESSGRRIDPARGPWPGSERVDVDGPGNPALPEWADAGLEAPDIDVIRQWRVGRLQAELARRDLAGVVLLDPINVHYATDSTNMQIFCMHNMVRYAWVAADGPVVASRSSCTNGARRSWRSRSAMTCATRSRWIARRRTVSEWGHLLEVCLSDGVSVTRGGAGCPPLLQ
jgi:hypothetical protein